MPAASRSSRGAAPGGNGGRRWPPPWLPGSTPQTTVAVGNERGILAGALIAGPRPKHELVAPNIERVLAWADVPLSSLGGIAVGLGPGLFTGMRVGIATAKTLSQALSIPVTGIASLDLLAYPARYGRRLICSTIDAKRGEVFFAFYRPVPGGVARQSSFQVRPPDRLASELEAAGEDILLVGNGGITYRRQLEEAGTHVEFASAALAYPSAAALVELATPRFVREEFGRAYDVQPYYVRKSDAEIAWNHRRGTG
jgi:tRNA threonylcarbamoyladenosine biosynthesis protein TsaB